MAGPFDFWTALLAGNTAALVSTQSTCSVLTICKFQPVYVKISFKDRVTLSPDKYVSFLFPGPGRDERSVTNGLVASIRPTVIGRLYWSHRMD